MTAKLRITLESLKGLTYNCNDVAVVSLETIHCKLNGLLEEFKQLLPTSQGLLIRPHLRSETIKSYRKKLSLKRLGHLLKYKTGRKKMSATYRGHVGAKASRLRKVQYIATPTMFNYYYRLQVLQRKVYLEVDTKLI